MTASTWLITSASLHPPLSALAVGITLVRAAGLFKAVFRYLDRYLSHEIMFKALTKIQLRLYKEALKIFPLKSGGRFEAPVLHELAVLADSLKDRFAKVIQSLLSVALISTAVTAYLFKVICLMSLILPLAMILTMIISHVLSKSEQSNDTAYRERLIDFYDALDEIKAAKSSAEIVNKLDESADQLKAGKKSQRFHTINADGICAVMNAALMILLLKELAGQVDIITLSMWLFILLMTFEMFTVLPNATRDLVNVESRMQNAELTPVNYTSTPLNEHSAIKIDHLDFAYDGTCKVLDNLNLEVQRGEKLAIIGESGSGKTTLLYLMLGLWQPDSGQIYINGSIAASTVNNYVFSKAIRENFSILNPNITEEEMLKFLSICQLDTLDIDRELGENGSKISGGERNRLQIALALATKSDILILDEPTAGLNKDLAVKLIHEVINEINEKDRTLIVITHDLAVAKIMDKIYRLCEGKIIYEG